jgi:hypothetical protein
MVPGNNAYINQYFVFFVLFPCAPCGKKQVEPKSTQIFSQRAQGNTGVYNVMNFIDEP